MANIGYKYDAVAYRKKIEYLYESMSDNESKNNRIMKKNKDFLSYTSYILNYCVFKDEDEIKSLNGIKYALKNGANPNKTTHGKNFIFNAIDYNRSEDFIFKILELGVMYNIDLNKRDEYGDTIFLKLLKKSYFTNNIIEVYELLKNNGYEILSVDKENKDVEFLINNSNKEYKNKEEFLKIYNHDKKTKILNIKYDYNIKEMYYGMFGDNTTLYKTYNFCEQIFNKIITDNLEEDYTYNVIKHLLSNGLDVNILLFYDNNFIQYIVCNSIHTFDYIYKLIELAIEHGLNVNHSNRGGDTLIHSLIISNNFTFKLIPIYELLMKNGFIDSTRNNKGNDIYSLALKQGYKFEDKEEFIYKYCPNNIKFNITKEIKQEDLEYLKLYGNFIKDKITNSYYSFNLRESQIKYKENNKNNILLLTGKKGLGLDETLLSSGEDEYQKYGTNIYYTSVEQIIKNCQNIASLKQTVLNILSKCATNNIIIFINDIYEIYGTNYNEEDLEFINNYIEYLVENKNLFLVGTLNNDNQYIFKNNNLNNMINYIDFYEINENELLEYLDFEFNKFNLNINEQLWTIINNIVFILNKKENRLNYDLISINDIIKNFIKNINAYLIINNLNEIDINSIIYSLNNLENIKKEIIYELINEIKVENNKIIKKLTK